MGKSYTGGCACGAVRYEVSAEPAVQADCQCRQCQRQSGTGHASYLTFVGAPVKVQGKAKSWDVTGDGGTVKSCAFCPDCGSPVYLTFPAMPDIFIVRAASLDEPTRYQPQMRFWSAAAQPWDRADPALTTFDRMPPAS
jgi:hypothetical protein